MKRLAILLAVFSFLLSSTQAQVTTFTETFDNGSNVGDWWFGIPNAPIEATGGNPGAYLHEPLLDTFAPQPRTQSSSSIFTGDYRANNVVSMGVDINIFSADFTTAGRPLSLMLIDDQGQGAYFLGNLVPLAGTGWQSYDYTIDSQSMTLPTGWLLIDMNTGGTPTHSWNDVITNVQEVRYFFGDPTYFFIFMQWDLGLDNARISTEVISQDPQFIRGDSNADQLFNIADMVHALGVLFTGEAVNCELANDVNDDDNLNIADVIYGLATLFSGGAPIPAPGSVACGVDPTPGSGTLSCLSSNCP